ncbi:hypothetical protein [Enterococcus faecalis]|jgi:hypothetical protein|uniref:hypothetical protein n=1 Tax=Enterococcus faecalis TaxID=1351 RepID=UPI001925A861|nr:hypothetical protein [Enterococcus faecalis]
MPKIYFDDFIKLTKDKMAQQMENMTYQYKETKVPKSHYKKMLETAQEEIIEHSVEINLIDTYYRTLEQLLKTNPKWLFQALLCIDTGVKPSTIKPAEYQALELTWSKFIEDKKAKTVDKVWLDYFENIKENGATYSLIKEQDNNF